MTALETNAGATVIDVSQDWVTASYVQQRFMQPPVRLSATLDYSARCRQLLQLGGDCFDLLPLPDNHLAITIGDASGKGVAAALMISSVQSSLRTALAFRGCDLAAVVGIVNRQVYASSLMDRYATVFYANFDAATRTLRYVNAGHNPPMVIRRDGSVIWLEAGGPPVGMFSDAHYEEGLVHLDAGDVVIAYTDGVIEALNPDGEEWGVKAMQKVAQESSTQCADSIVNAIFTTVDEYSQGRQTDDATVLAMRVQ